MITYLIVKNFQAHKKFKARLEPITTFTGPTDSGKSSIVKALYWAMMNRPRGESFLNDPELPAFVGIKTDDGQVSRKRGKGINNYKLNGQVLEAFGTDVPIEVQEFFKMGELNFQLQFDSPYWFFISAGEVSKQLNQIVDLEIIDTAMTRLASKKREANTAVTIHSEKVDELSIQLYELGFVEQMGEDFDQLEALEKRIETESASVDALRVTLADVQQHIQEAETLTSARSACQTVLKSARKLEKMNEETETLAELVVELRRYQTITEQEIPNADHLVAMAEQLEQSQEEINSLGLCIEDTKMEQERVWQKEKRLQSEKRKLEKIMGKTCPLCKTRIR